MLIDAAKRNTLAVLECVDATTGEPRYVLTEVGKAQGGDDWLLVPFGHMPEDVGQYVPPIGVNAMPVQKAGQA